MVVNVLELVKFCGFMLKFCFLSLLSCSIGIVDDKDVVQLV